MKRPALLVAVAALCAATVLGAGAAELEPGQELSAANVAQAEGLLPPEILGFYKRGDWKNTIAEWPDGRLRRDEDFEEAKKWNAAHLALDARGTIVDKRSGKKPEAIHGFPFPNINPADSQAGAKVIWNYFYGIYDGGNSHASVDLAWVSRKGLDRAAGIDSQILYYDGQKAKYRPKTNPQDLLSQTLASVTYPQDLYSTTVLAWRFREPDKRDLNWTYVPALRRVREVSPANRSDGFLGSDLTQDDGQFFDGKPEDFTWKLIGETEMYRLADPYALKGEAETRAIPGGGWQSQMKAVPFIGFENPGWQGAPWAPVAAVLAKRKLWIIEAVPKDPYYLYGKIELYIDKEGFVGAWNRKFSRSGELLAAFVPTGAPTVEVTGEGGKELITAFGSIYLAGLNLKMDRATVTGFPLEDRDKMPSATRVPLDPAAFDYQSLQNRAK